MNTLLTSATVSADVTELDTDLVTPGVLGFLVIFAIALVLYFLMRSMTGKLGELPKEKTEQDDRDEAADAGDASEEAEEQAPADSDHPGEQAENTSRRS